MKYILIKQHDEKDCGAACLSMISSWYGLKLPITRFRELIKVDNNGASFYGLIDGALKIGLYAEGLDGTPDELLEEINKKEIVCPFIARLITYENFEHYVVVYKITNDKIIIGDPAKGIVKLPYGDFFNQWSGHIVTFELTDRFQKANECKGTLSKFFKLITRQYKLLLIVFMLSLIITSIGIMGTFIFQYIVDDVIAATDLGENLNLVCLALIFLYALKAVIQVIRGYLVALISKRIDVSLMLGYYNHVVELPVSFFGTRKTGEIISRFSDATKIREAISGATLTLMVDIVMVVFCGIILFSISNILFFIALVIMAIYSVVTLSFAKPIKEINQITMEDNAQVTSYLKESIDGIETVKSFNSEKLVVEKTEKKFMKFTDNVVKGSIIYSLQQSLVDVVASIGIVILLYFGTSFVLQGHLTLGALITFYSLIIYFLSPIKNLIGLQPMLQTAVVAAERLNDILELQKEVIDGINTSGTLKVDIEFRNIDFRYGNRELILENFNMQIKKCQRIAIVGESGCGKTTLAKLLMAFYCVENGKIILGDQPINELTPQFIRSRISYISQNIFLFSDTIRNNLLLGNENATQEEIVLACKLSLADSFINEMPLGYNTMLEENGNNLSGGQKQRLAIARALLKHPDILIMDEATSNLDTMTEQSIKNAISTLNDMTCIIIAHRLNTIKNCDQIFVMDKGRIIENGTHKQLIDFNGVYSRLWKEQE